MVLYDLTQEQCDMLDTMWDKQNAEELFDWFLTLSDKKFEMAMTLHEMLMQEVVEENWSDGTTLAKQMLTDIGVNT